jgi:hypothetical protein
VSVEGAERGLGPNHLQVADILSILAKICEKIGKEDEAQRLEERAKKSVRVDESTYKRGALRPMATRDDPVFLCMFLSVILGLHTIGGMNSSRC